MSQKECTIEGCDRVEQLRHSMCDMHYRRWRKRGDPGPAANLRPDIPVEERFWRYVEPTGFCWNWTGGRSDGYGRFAVSGGRAALAHRLSYELLVGELPDLPLDHLCRNILCVNPDHLEPVTIAVNTKRGYTGWTGRTHCKNGHDITVASNVYRGPKGRRCRRCMTEASRRYRAR